MLQVFHRVDTALAAQRPPPCGGVDSDVRGVSLRKRRTAKAAGAGTTLPRTARSSHWGSASCRRRSVKNTRTSIVHFVVAVEARISTEDRCPLRGKFVLSSLWGLVS